MSYLINQVTVGESAGNKHRHPRKQKQKKNPALIKVSRSTWDERYRMFMPVGLDPSSILATAPRDANERFKVPMNINE